MIWYVLTWLDNAGNPVKRELLNRASKEKVFAYIEGRIRVGRVPERAWGFHFREAHNDETVDQFGDPHVPSAHAVEI